MAALRAAVFPLSAKNRRGGHFLPPPSSARVKVLVLRGTRDILGGWLNGPKKSNATIIFTIGATRAAESESESVVLLGVGVGVDKIYRLRPTPGNVLFAIQRNCHAD